MRFAAKFSQTTGKSTIHAPTCSSAAKRSGFVVVEISAESPEAAAVKFEQDGDLQDRGYPFPAVCKCAKPSGPKALAAMLRF